MSASAHEKLEALRHCELFRGLGQHELLEVAGAGSIEDYGRGELLFMEDEPAEGFFVALSGKVRIYKQSPQGREQTLRMVGPGETFAEAAMFSGGSYPASAEAIADSRVVRFTRNAFHAAVRRNPQLAMNMLGVLAQNLRRLTALVEELSLKEVSARLAKYLLDLALRSRLISWPAVVRLPVSKTQLAARLGTAGETLSRTFRRLTQQGVISVKGAEISLRDRGRLERLSAGLEP